MPSINDTFSNGQPSKVCAKCELPMPLSEFHNCSSSADGLTSYCKACQSAKRKDYYWKNREAQLEKQKIYEREKWRQKKLLAAAMYQDLTGEQLTEKKEVYLANKKTTPKFWSRHEKNRIGKVTDSYCRKLISVQLHIDRSLVTQEQIEIKRNALWQKRLIRLKKIQIVTHVKPQLSC